MIKKNFFNFLVVFLGFIAPIGASITIDETVFVSPGNGRNMVRTSQGHLFVATVETPPIHSNVPDRLMFSESRDDGNSWLSPLPIIENNRAFCLDGSSTEFGLPDEILLGGVGMAIDSNDVPHVVFLDNRGQIFHTKLTNDCWTAPEPILTQHSEEDGFPVGFSIPSIAIDKNNNIYVVYEGYGIVNSQFNRERTFIFYLKFDGLSWSPEEIIYDDDYGKQERPTIDVDEFDVPHVVWEKNLESIYYARLDPSGVQIREVASKDQDPNSEVNGPSLAVGPNGNIFISWIDEVGLSHPAAYFSRVWVTEFKNDVWTDTLVHEFPKEVDGNGNGFGQGSISTSLALDTDGNPHLIWGTYFFSLVQDNRYAVYRAHRASNSTSFNVQMIEDKDPASSIYQARSFLLRYSFHHMNGGKLNWTGEYQYDDESDDKIVFGQDSAIVMPGGPTGPIANAGPDLSVEDLTGDDYVKGLGIMELQRVMNLTPNHPSWHPIYNIVSSDPEIIDSLDLAALEAAYGSRPGDSNWNPHADWDGAGVEEVQLDGTASVGNIVSYAWEVDGQTYTGPNPTVQLVGLGNHTGTLTVTNDLGQTAQDTVTINLYPMSNNHPTADAESDLIISDTIGDGIISGKDKKILQRAMRLTPEHPDWHPRYNIDDSDDEINEMDLNAWEASYGARPGDSHWNPQADINGIRSEDVVLNAFGSQDSDGMIVRYKWEDNFNGERRLLYNGPAAITEVTLDGIGVHTLTLTVQDDKGAQHQDTMTVTLNEDGLAPLVSAGPDFSIGLSQVGLLATIGRTTLNGSVIDSDTNESWLKVEWFVEECYAGVCGEVEFEDKSDPQTAVRFRKSGIYTLGLKAFDGDHESIDTVEIKVGTHGIDIIENPNESTNNNTSANTTKAMFNPLRGEEGEIQFSMSHAGDVAITIYDRNMTNVKDMHHAYYSAGTHTMSWDGRDQNGQIVASGTYHVLINSSQYKLIVAK